MQAKVPKLGATFKCSYLRRRDLSEVTQTGNTLEALEESQVIFQ